MLRFMLLVSNHDDDHVQLQFNLQIETTIHSFVFLILIEFCIKERMSCPTTTTHSSLILIVHTQAQLLRQSNRPVYCFDDDYFDNYPPNETCNYLLNKRTPVDNFPLFFSKRTALLKQEELLLTYYEVFVAVHDEEVHWVAFSQVAMYGGTVVVARRFRLVYRNSDWAGAFDSPRGFCNKSFFLFSVTMFRGSIEPTRRMR